MEKANKTDELEKIKKEFEEFAYIVSHDLKAPLRAINNLSQWIEEDFGEDINGEIKENFDLLKNRVVRMSAMIDALTQYSRVNRYETEVLEVNLEELINEIREDLELRFPNVKINILSDLPIITTYKKKLYRVIAEILENAVIHNKQKENLMIQLEAKNQDDSIIFNISDDGIGIPENQLEEVFKIFKTIESKEKTETIGAGLAVVKKIIEFVKGKIELKSVANTNTSITIHWPL